MSDWTWRKSSRSAGNGQCVEVGWRKSARSLANGDCVEVGWRSSTRCDSGACVEIAAGMVTVAVRDSKDPAGGMLKLSHGEWSSFLAGVKAGEHDGPA